jgi:hypothetical protein
VSSGMRCPIVPALAQRPYGAATMRLDISAPFFGSLNGSFQIFYGRLLPKTLNTS